MSRRLELGWALLALGVLVQLGGCSRAPAVGTVKGEVTLNKQPLKDGNILFTPIGGQGQTGGGKITDGKFTVQVPVANMKVEITSSRVIGKRRVYETDPKSPLMDEVVEDIPHQYNINSGLTLDVKQGEQTVQYDLKKP